jgi:hypothetical protein
VWRHGTGGPADADRGGRGRHGAAQRGCGRELGGAAQGTGQILMGVTALGITAYLKNGARWRRPRRWRPTTARARQFYDRRREELNLDEVERIRL